MHYPVSVGLDVHKTSISACAVDLETGEMSTARFGYDAQSIAKWVKDFGGEVRCVYESGFCGFDLYRKLTDLGVTCYIAASSKIDRDSSRVKTDKRDAKRLSRKLIAGELSFCAIPTLEQEGIRHIGRLYIRASEELSSQRLRIGKHCQLYGYNFGGTNFTKPFYEWARKLEFPTPFAREAFEELLCEEEHLVQKKADLSARCLSIAKESPYASYLDALSGLKGLSHLSAFLILAELFDLTRFPNPASLGTYLGLVPQEASSGQSRKLGSITKCGNSRVRKLLIEASWTYTRTSHSLKKLSPDLDKRIVSEIRRQTRRLTRKRAQMKKSGKQSCKANTATARELAEVIWIIVKACDSLT